MSKQVVHNHNHVAGYGIGSVLAAIVSWTVNKSVGWAAVHFLLGWMYVFYACCVHTDRLDVVVHEAVDQ